MRDDKVLAWSDRLAGRARFLLFDLTARLTPQVSAKSRIGGKCVKGKSPHVSAGVLGPAESAEPSRGRYSTGRSKRRKYAARDTSIEGAFASETTGPSRSGASSA